MTCYTMYNQSPFNRDENSQETYERLMHNFNHGFGYTGKKVPANITETDQEYKIEMALPGVDKKDIRVEQQKEFLTIRIEKQAEPKEGEDYTRREFDYSGASRTFRTADKVNTDNITARYENGVLTVHLPKKEVSTPKSQLIEVE
jgi:HSP20 family protein